MQRFGGMQEKRGRARAGERRRDFSADQPGLAHPADHHAPFAREQHVYRFFEAGVEACEHVLNRLGFDFEHATGRFQAHDDAPQRRTTVLRPFNFKSSACSSESGKAFGPSERAADGLSWVSRKIPSTPAATAARASGSINCGCPPLERPCPPGSCTECVTSKTTG